MAGMEGQVEMAGMEGFSGGLRASNARVIVDLGWEFGHMPVFALYGVLTGSGIDPIPTHYRA